MTAITPLIGIFFGAFFVLFPGWGIRQILKKLGLQWSDDETSFILSSFALGVHLNALLFLICWVLVGPDKGSESAAFIITINLTIGFFGWLFRSPTSTPCKSLWLCIIVGLLVGEFAAFQFPHVFDSVQVLQVQRYILGWEGGTVTFPTVFARLEGFLMGGMTVPMQPGFAGLIFLPSLVQSDLPVTTVASGMKIVLVALAAVVSYYVASQFNFRWRLAAALLIFANLVFSHFGLYGLISTGKDSVFAILMATAAIASVYSNNDRKNESGLFMSTAVLLGAVAVPYLLTFWMIYFVVSFGATIKQALRQAVWCIYPLTISVLGVHSAFSESGAHTIGLLPAFCIEVLMLAVAFRVSRKISLRSFQSSANWNFLMSFLPLICIIGIIFMLPAKVLIPLGYKDSMPVFSSFPPLDGITTASGFFYSISPTNNPWLSTVALFVCAALPLTSPKFRTPFFTALFSFLPAATFLVLAHLHLRLRILPEFNIWDITRDTVQWYVGAFGAVFALLGTQGLVRRFPEKTQWISVPLMVAVFIVGLAINYPHFIWLITKPKTVTSSGGFWDQTSAQAMDFIWRKARGAKVYISQNSAFGEYYGAFPLFGAEEVSFFSETALRRNSGNTVYLTNGSDAKRVIEVGKQRRASMDITGLAEDSYIIFVIFDEKNKVTANNVPKLTLAISGDVHSVEETQGKNFRWVGERTKILARALVNDSKDYCAELDLINTWADPHLKVTITTSTGEKAISVPFDADFVNPFTVYMCAPITQGVAAIELKSNQMAKQFPNDNRKISFGLVWPPREGSRQNDSKLDVPGILTQ